MGAARKATRELIEPLSSQHTVSDMARILGLSTSVIARACVKFGLTPKRHATNDYSELPKLAQTMHRAELARHYGVTYNTLCEVCQRLGVVPIRQSEAERREVRLRTCAVARAAKPLSPRLKTQFKASSVTDHRPKTNTDLAADYLRRFTHVYRCNERGMPDHKGTHWRYGVSVKTPDELIERARDKGWNPDEWRMCA